MPRPVKIFQLKPIAELKFGPPKPEKEKPETVAQRKLAKKHQVSPAQKAPALAAARVEKVAAPIEAAAQPNKVAVVRAGMFDDENYDVFEQNLEAQNLKKAAAVQRPRKAEDIFEVLDKVENMNAHIQNVNNQPVAKQPLNAAEQIAEIEQTLKNLQGELQAAQMAELVELAKLKAAEKKLGGLNKEIATAKSKVDAEATKADFKVQQKEYFKIGAEYKKLKGKIMGLQDAERAELRKLEAAKKELEKQAQEIPPKAAAVAMPQDQHDALIAERFDAQQREEAERTPAAREKMCEQDAVMALRIEKQQHEAAAQNIEDEHANIEFLEREKMKAELEEVGQRGLRAGEKRKQRALNKRSELVVEYLADKEYRNRREGIFANDIPFNISAYNSAHRFMHAYSIDPAIVNSARDDRNNALEGIKGNIATISLILDSVDKQIGESGVQILNNPELRTLVLHKDLDISELERIQPEAGVLDDAYKAELEVVHTSIRQLRERCDRLKAACRYAGLSRAERCVEVARRCGQLIWSSLGRTTHSMHVTFSSWDFLPWRH